MCLRGLRRDLDHGEAESASGESLARLPGGRQARRKHEQYDEGSAGSNAEKAIQGGRGEAERETFARKFGAERDGWRLRREAIEDP